MSNSSHRRLGIRVIEHLVKEGMPHPVEQMRGEHLFGQGVYGLNQQYGGASGNDADPQLLAESPEYMNAVKGLYDKYMRTNPPAEEKAPRVVSVAK